ncbi:MAG: M1 family aminopeptidase, partial [Gemmatimonadota bacterium]
RFTLTPPTPVEQASLKRLLEVDSVDMRFRTAVLFFTDVTEGELAQALHWASMEPPGDARKEVEEALDYVSDDDGWVSRDLMVPLLNRRSGIFYAQVAWDRGDPLIYTVNPYAYEEVSLYRRNKGKGKYREVVTRFHRQSDYATGSSLPQEALDLVRADHYDIESTIAGNLDLTGTTTAHLSLVADEHTWVPFTLHQDLEVDSVRWGDGSPAPFSRPERSSDLWVDVSGMPANPADLVFHYHGDILDQRQDFWVQPKTFTSWYPMHQYGRPATYRITFHAPEEYTLASVGKVVSADTTDDVVTQVWETPPVRQITFNIGNFETKTVEGGIGPHLTVQVSERAHAHLNDLMFQAGYMMGEQRDMAGVVAADLTQAFVFFNQAFGPTPVKDFVATEIPTDHGQAFPGLVLLSWSTFQSTSRKGYDEMFRAHEVAHQWWGIGVRPATDHDRWMAEGFAEFSGLWYMARVRGSTDLYADRLEESRKKILARRDEAAPIWLGTRTGTSSHPEDYETIVYGKGAWVLHMLRMLVTDFDGGSEDTFEKIMHDFYSSHLGQAASTEQFIQTVEQDVGGDMKWFFNEWVYGSAIPTYTFSYKLEEQPNGEYKAFVRVRQEDVPDDFKMVVPILLDFGDEGTAVVRVLVEGPLTEAELPILPMKPDDVEFNCYEAVLAETKTEGWKGS